MKKTLSKLLIIAVITVVAFSGCKKGAEDPAISLLSRKARLTGTWTISSGSWTVTNYSSKSASPFTPNPSAELMGHLFGKSNSSTTEYNFQNGKLTITKDGDGYVEDYSDSVIFKKDGSFEEYQTENYKDGDYTDETNTILKGYWYFLPANKELDVKNKQRVLIELSERTDSTIYSYSNHFYTNVNTVTYEGSNWENEMIFDFNELSNKEIKISLNKKVTYNDVDYDETVGEVTYTQVK